MQPHVTTVASVCIGPPNTPAVGHHERMDRPSRSTLLMIALLGGSGALHLIRPDPFVTIVPRSMPAAKELVYLSGVAELACAALMGMPVTRRWGGSLAAALLVAVFPANVSMALQARGRPPWYRIAAWARLPLQAPLVAWAWRAGRHH